MVNEDGVCLGVYDDYQWHREKLQGETATKRELNTARLLHLDISEKESYRWLLGYQHATELARRSPNTEVIMIADREDDIYDIYDQARDTQDKKANWLIRMKTTNRTIMKQFNCLVHHYNEGSLKQCYNELDGKKAVGLDEIDKAKYGEQLDDNIKELLKRMKQMSYRPGSTRKLLLRLYLVNSVGILFHRSGWLLL